MSDYRLSFVHNIAAAMDHLGVHNIPVGYMLSRISYESLEDRESVMTMAAVALGTGGEVSSG